MNKTEQLRVTRNVGNGIAEAAAAQMLYVGAHAVLDFFLFIAAPSKVVTDGLTPGRATRRTGL